MPPLRLGQRLPHVEAALWSRAEAYVRRGWLREARRVGTSATASCIGLVGVRCAADLATLATRCECHAPQPCEHALALLLAFADAVPEAPDPARWRIEAGELPRVVLLHGDGIPDDVVEALRWLWWRRDAPDRASGEARTLAQALQILARHGIAVTASADGAAPAKFRQRALGEPIAVRVEEPALAEGLARRGGRPLPGPIPTDWTIADESAFASWWLEATAAGAVVLPDASLDPRPLSGRAISIDVGCLPVRVSPADPDVASAVADTLGAPAETDAGHLLVPATRVVDVEDRLRALGAALAYRKLAPPGRRHLAWPEEAPEDLVGARPRLREPFRGALEARPPGLRPEAELSPYQEEAVAFLLHHEHTCLLADDMGLGKTLEAIAAAQFLAGRVLVVCPASARRVWAREVGKFTVEAAAVVEPGEPAAPAFAASAKYVVVGYGALETLGPLPPFDLVILDESHYVKNAASERARLARSILSPIPRRLVVSGTPVMNAPEEIRAQLAFLHPEEWSDGEWFRSRYTEPFDEGTPEVRAAVLRRLRQFLEGVMIRREKAEALPDLPSKTLLWRTVELPPEARAAYRALETDFASYVASAGSASLATSQAAARMEHLKQCAVAGKLPEAVAAVRALVAGGEKVVVFSRYRDVLASLGRDLADLGAVTLTGSTSPVRRAEAERAFQADEACRVFLGQLVAAGTALTLTSGTHVVFLDLDWNPANHRQAMDRIHRRGQTRPVTAHFFLAKDTIDEDVARVLEAKGKMMDALLAATGAAAAPRGVKRAVGERIVARAAPASAVTAA